MMNIYRHFVGYAITLAVFWLVSSSVRGAESRTWQVSGRAGVVAAGKAEAVAAGVAVLEAGGNAADAAVATLLAMSVTDYGLFCIGGEVPILVYDARRQEVQALSGVGEAPRDPDAIRWYLEHGIPRDMKSAAVPAAVSACFETLKRYGTMSFEQVVAPTLVLLDSGKAPWYPRLAATLRKLVETEQRTAGNRAEKLQAARDHFYTGDIADALEAWYIEHGGFLRKTDLAAHVTHVEEPVKVEYRGYVVCKCGPWTQGPMLLQALRLLEGFDLAAMGHASADYIHLATEALKLALADRDAYYGDPRFVKVPLDVLLADAYTRLRTPLIERTTASREVRPGDPFELKPLRGPGTLRPAPGGTTTCCVADRWGNVVAATPSANPPYVPPGATGVTHGTRLTSFNTARGHPNCIEPGKRPRVTLTPTIVLKNGKPIMALSVAGGDLQDQTTLNLILAVVDFGMRPDRAVTAPRFATRHHESSFNPSPHRTAALGKLASLHLANVDDAVAEALARRGHTVTRTNGPIGHPVMIWIDPVSGIQYAAGDPRAGRHAGAAAEK